MSEYRQPWRRFKLCGRQGRLQILDPETAFDLEPEIVDAIGDVAAFAAAAPDELLGVVMRQSVPSSAGMPELHELARDPVAGPAMASDSIVMLGRLLARCIDSASVDPTWVSDVFRRTILGRLEIGSQPVDTVAEWARLGLPPIAKWVALAGQVRQTYGPLWTRSPYHVRSTAKDYGVPAPKSVSVAKRWADSLARRGSASSAREILREWPPVEMIEIVESAAYDAEVERRAQEQAKAGGR